VDDVLAAAAMPVVLVRGERMSGRSLPGVFAKALVPVTGSMNSRAAQEVAAALSARIGTELVLTHLDPAPPISFDFGGDGTAVESAMADQLLRTASASAALSGAGRVSTRARRAESIPGELVRITVEEEVDLVVVGATLRQAPEGSYLGPVVSHLLDVCPATVVVVVTPVGWSGRH
jgi:nucleotide-binding universal stress UspA family protein